MFKLFTLKSPSSGWSSEDSSRFLSFFLSFNVHKWREHLTLYDLHLLAVYSMMDNPRIVNYLITFYLCLLRVCMELLNMDRVVEFCKLINIKTVTLHSESWTFICLISLFLGWHWPFCHCWRWAALASKLLQRITIRWTSVTPPLTLVYCQTAA